MISTDSMKEIRTRHLKIAFFGGSDEGDGENVATTKKEHIVKLVKSLNADPTLAKVTVFTGGYGGTMNMIAGCFQQYLIDEITKEIVGVVSEIYGTKEYSDGLKEGKPNKISGHNNRLIWTENLQERLDVLIESAPNIIVLPGKQGTFIELLLADEGARLAFKETKTHTKHFFLDVFWKDILLNSKYLRGSYYVRSERHSFIETSIDYKKRFIYSSNIKEIKPDSKISSLGDTDLTSLHDRINSKLVGLKDWKNCIEGLDFAYTIKFGNKIEESKFSNIGKPTYSIATKNFLKDKSILRGHIEDKIVSYYTYANYTNNSDPIFTNVEIQEPKDIPPQALENRKIKFADWVEYLKTKKIGSSTIFLFEKFETSYSGRQTGYEMYYSLFLTLNVNVTPRITSLLKNILKDFLFRISNSKSIEIFERKEISLKITSVKSSLSAVMARNMSHNIGSHVLSRTLTPEDVSFPKIVKKWEDGGAQYCNIGMASKESSEVIEKNNEKLWDKYYQEEIDNSLNNKFAIDTFQKKYNRLAKLPEGILFATALKLLAQQELANERIAYFNSYLKSRQELLAEIVVSPAQLSTTKSLREAVEGFTNNRVLLDRISGLDNFKFTFKLDIWLDGEKDDVLVSMPNDILGQQALYIIIENIIRNTAKHGAKIAENGKLNEHIIFTIRVRESSLDPSQYQVTIFDNIKSNRDTVITKIMCSNPEEAAALQEIFPKSVHDIECEDCTNKCTHTFSKVPLLTNVIYDQNKRIDLPILDNDNNLRSHSLGVIEMEACAAYLRQIPIEAIQDLEFLLSFNDADKKILREAIIDKQKRHRILRAVNPLTIESLQKICRENISDRKELPREDCLGYRFYLSKPKELLIVDADGSLLEKNEISIEILIILEGKGILVLDGRDKPTLDATYNFDAGRIYSYETLLWYGCEKKLQASKLKLPKRILVDDDKNFIELLKYLAKNNADVKVDDDTKNQYQNLIFNVIQQIVKQKFLSKNLKPSLPRLQEILNIENEENLEELNIELQDHGGIYKVLTKFHSQIYTHKEKPFIEKFILDDNYLKTTQQLIHLESAVNNIVVIDERVQEMSETIYHLQALKDGTLNRPKGISYREIWQNAGCFIPSKNEVALSSSDYVGTLKKIKEFIKKTSEGTVECFSEDYLGDLTYGNNEKGRQYTNIDTLIIHIGVIEKCIVAMGEDKNDLRKYDYIIKSILSIEDTSDVNVILMSGRAPRKDALPNNYSFLSLSVITNYLIENRFKYTLHQLCHSARQKL